MATAEGKADNMAKKNWEKPEITELDMRMTESGPSPSTIEDIDWHIS